MQKDGIKAEGLKVQDETKGQVAKKDYLFIVIIQSLEDKSNGMWCFFEGIHDDIVNGLLWNNFTLPPYNKVILIFQQLWYKVHC